jgi:hypothetical protein
MDNLQGVGGWGGSGKVEKWKSGTAEGFSPEIKSTAHVVVVECPAAMYKI